MSLFDRIEKLRNKPEGARKRTAILGAFLVTGIIAIIWLSIVFVTKKEVKEEIYYSPFSIIKEIINK